MKNTVSTADLEKGDIIRALKYDDSKRFPSHCHRLQSSLLCPCCNFKLGCGDDSKTDQVTARSWQTRKLFGLRLPRELRGVRRTTCLFVLNWSETLYAIDPDTDSTVTPCPIEASPSQGSGTGSSAAWRASKRHGMAAKVYIYIYKCVRSLAKGRSKQQLNFCYTYIHVYIYM